MTRHSSRLPAAYWRQWAASAVSNLGDGINFAAMPLLALSLTDDERLLSLTTFASFLPWMLLALPTGVIVDRVDRRTLMVIASLARVVLFGVIAVGAVEELLSIWVLVLLLVVIGSFEVVFDSSAQAFLPMLVREHQLARANGYLFAAEVVAGSIAGLAVGAYLFDLSTGLPFSANAASFAIAAALIFTIRPLHPPVVEVGNPFDQRLRAGMAWLSRHTMLRTLAAMFAVTNLGLMFGQGIFVKFAIDELGLETSQYGILLAITAVGAASGGMLGPRVIERFGRRVSIVSPYLVFGGAQLVIGLAPPAWVVASAGFVMGFGVTVWNIVTVTIRQQVIPPDRFGRVNAVYRWLGAAASAVGVAAGGWVAYATNLRAPFLVGGAITVLAAAVFGRTVLRELAALDRRDRTAQATPEPPSIT